MKTKIIRYSIIVIGLLLVAALYAWKEYHRAPVDLHELKAEISISADSLYTAFERDEAAANQLYLDKVIEVYGTVSSIKQTDSISNITLNVEAALMGAVNCSTSERIETAVGSEVKLRGLCQGFLMDVVLNQCVQVK